ncbi:MAG: hypothetical protein HUU45_12385, partial [Leptospiraceae bacterium]|nr:hypothetical protein [Leptospiraceae bacterium]
MNPYPLNPIPEMPINPTEILYFWYNLPFAVPGTITFIVGLTLTVIGIFHLRKKEHFGYFLSFSGTCAGFGILGLILSLRAIVRDENLLLSLNTYLYPFVLLLAPASYHLVYYILDKKYSIIQWAAILNWVTTLFGFIGILKGEAFTGNFIHYSFGIYPVASFYLKPWAVLATIGYILIGFPAYYFFLKSHSFHERRFLVVGHNLLLILVISNLPSFIGIPIFPASTFSFIPMCILAYGIFNSDFKDLKRLFLDKSRLFYILNIFLSFVLLLIAGIVLFTFSPDDYDTTRWYPWLLIPLVSVFVVVGLGIFIGGTSPYRLINQLGSISL